MSGYIMKYYMGKIRNLKCYMAINVEGEILFTFEKNSVEVFTIEVTEELAEKIMKDYRSNNRTNFEQSVYKNIKSQIIQEERKMKNKGIIRIEESDTKKIIKLLEEIKEENKKEKTVSITTQTGKGIQAVIEKEMKEKKEEITIGKKITVKGSGGIGTEILLDDKYLIGGLYNFKTEMDAENGSKVILEFLPHEIEIKTNRMENITKKNGEENE